MTTVIVAFVLRLLASLGDVWLDEIWTWKYFAIRARSFLEIALAMRHDNNHVLNTWIISLFPPGSPWIVYRLPAVAAGVGTVILAGLSGGRRGTCEGFLALILTAASSVLIQYSSEARGYAYLLFFTMLCVWLVERIAQAQSNWNQWLFALGACGGFLSHFSFATAYVGLVLWSGVAVSRCYPSWRDRLPVWLRMHLLPSLVGLLLVVGNGSAMIVGGGNRLKLIDVLVQSGSLAAGGPNSGPWAVAICIGVLIAAIVGLVCQWRRGQTAGIFWVSTAVSLGLIIFVFNLDLFYVRYFVIEIVGVIMMISLLLARLWRHGTTGKVLVALLTTGMVAGNSIHTARLIRDGRGGYRAAVEYLQQQSAQTPITVGSDHDFRNFELLDFYYSRLPDRKPMRYYGRREWPAEGVEWLLLHSFEEDPVIPREIPDNAGHRYRFEKQFRYSGLSGWHWLLYRRIPPG